MLSYPATIPLSSRTLNHLAERIRGHRKQRRSRLRHHHYPHLGDRPIRAITVTDVLEWVATLLRNNVAQSSVKT
jgi:hypothetical protein